MGMLQNILRVVQLVLSVIVMGIDGHAIHIYRSYTSEEHAWFGDFDVTNGVPSAWGFLLFCAVWTFLGVIFLTIAAAYFMNYKFVAYICVAVDAVALLSWLAGFIAVAVNVGTSACPAEEHGCGELKAEIVFGAVEWLLFMLTTFLALKLVLFIRHKRILSESGKLHAYPADSPEVKA